MITITLKTLSVVIFFSVDSFIAVFLFDIDLFFLWHHKNTKQDHTKTHSVANSRYSVAKWLIFITVHKEYTSLVHHYDIKIFKELLKMKNIYAKAWICVGVMMLGIVILMSSLAFLGNKVMMNICLVLGAIAFLAGIILNFIIMSSLRFSHWQSIWIEMPSLRRRI